ncbi:outer membrane protein OmpU [Tranquillimonas rosea]|uniref:Outer membrane protein OmpU n=1 Tax=Tranquillimonas rosea TaxID=641238 RepID=A0A1H9U5S8_9RHOB|nr:porin [Tranquillimonas rosea]SES04719.1 outer membrane protein OmpU [Tranquillimonas rosea]
MKKLLLATSALVASAGMAAADLELTGSANMGVTYVDDEFDSEDVLDNLGDTTDGELALQYEIDLNVVGSGTTDSGLTFGASIDLDASIDRDSGNQNGLNEDFDPEVFISGNFGTLTVGNLDPATDGLGISDIGFDELGTTTTDLDDVAEYGKVVGSANMNYEYAFGDFAALVSAHTVTEDYGVALTYAPGNYSVALGYDYDDVNDDESYTLSGGATFGAFAVEATYTNYDIADDDGNSYGLLGSYEVGALTLSATVGDSDEYDDTAYGVGAAYDLGGGASLAGAVGSVNDQTVADLGVNFTF